MEFRDPSSDHHSPAAQHSLNLHQQPPLLLSQPDLSSSFSYFPNPNPNPSPNPTHAFDNPLPSSSSSATDSDVPQPPGVDSYLRDPYATHLAYDGAHSIASQSYVQMPAAYYYQQPQQYASNSFSYGVAGTGNTTAALELKKLKLIAGGAPPGSVRVCSICNVVCNSDTVFAHHLAGEKHALKAFGIPSSVLKPKVPADKKALHLTKKATLPTPRPTAKSAAKKVSKALVPFVQSSYCDVCKIDCNSQEVLNNHRLGRKHIKNLQKLQEATKPKPACDPVKKSTPIVNPSASESKPLNEQPKQNAGSAGKEDLETKKQKVLRGGAAADAVRVCTHCNVVCNSEAVYSLHISGKKHIAMMNNQKQPAPIS